jgi:hypothetical protein
VLLLRVGRRCSKQQSDIIYLFTWNDVTKAILNLTSLTQILYYDVTTTIEFCSSIRSTSACPARSLAANSLQNSDNNVNNETKRQQEARSKKEVT